MNISLWCGCVGWLLLLHSACQSSPDEPDAIRYARLLSAPLTDLQAALADCAALQDPDLQGDCGLAIARRAAPSLPTPEDLCDDIQGEIWQAECYFMAAEDYNAKGDAPNAARLCLKAAAFSDHCAQHLWQNALRGLTWTRGSHAFAKSLPQAQALYRAWSPLLAEETDLEDRFWRRFYEGGFERDRQVDPSACDPLPTEEDQLRCRTAAASFYNRRIQEVAHIPRAMAALCRIAAPTSAALAATPVPEFRAVPSPVLDPVVARAWERSCQQDGSPKPVSPKPVFDPAP